MLAWFCANSPQSLTFNAIVWAKGARHFSHQEQLRAEVASLLARTHMKAGLTTARPAPPAPPAIPVPDEAVMRKIDLAANLQASPWIPSWELAGFDSFHLRAGPSDRAEPALLPPRILAEA